MIGAFRAGRGWALESEKELKVKRVVSIAKAPEAGIREGIERIPKARRAYNPSPTNLESEKELKAFQGFR